jgi:hypothetical protein
MHPALISSAVSMLDPSRARKQNIIFLIHGLALNFTSHVMEQTINSMGSQNRQVPFPIISIGEEPPYVFPFSNLQFKGDKLEVRFGKIPNYEFENFGKLVQAVSSFGCCCLSHRLGIEVKQYFLAEKFRIRKLNYSTGEGELRVVGHAITASKRRGKSVMDVFDQEDKLKYKLELDLNVISEDTFSKLLKDHKDNTEVGMFSDELPVLNNAYINDDQFTISIEGFSHEQVIGHFTGFPIVPAAFVASCIVSGIKKWFKFEENKTGPMQIDSMEIFPNRAIPIRTKLIAETMVTKLTLKTYMFISQIRDQSGREYGAYILTIKV